VPVTITRLYGYNDPVQVKVKLPEGAKGLKVAELTIPAGQSTGVLAVEAGKDATLGSHAISVQAVSKFNGQDLSVSADTTLTVEAEGTAAK
jgi:hypothetical protein